jgi:hypothetical protein
MKHKYMEALNRRLSWERQNPIFPRHFGFKGFMCSAWRSQDPRPGGRWIDVDEWNKTRDGQHKNSRGIEDVEQSAFDKLLDNKDGIYDRVRAKSRIWLMSANNVINPILTSSPVQQDTPRRTTYGQEGFRRRFQHFQSQQNPEPEREYEIDPITNRKVFKNKSTESTPKPVEVPVKTFKGYGSQFQDFAPPASQSIEPGVKTYIPPSDSPSRPAAGHGERSGPCRESLKDYENDRQYKPFFRYEPDGQKPDPKNESLNAYDTRASFEGSRWEGAGGRPEGLR